MTEPRHTSGDPKTVRNHQPYVGRSPTPVTTHTRDDSFSPENNSHDSPRDERPPPGHTSRRTPDTSTPQEGPDQEQNHPEVLATGTLLRLFQGSRSETVEGTWVTDDIHPGINPIKWCCSGVGCRLLGPSVHNKRDTPTPGTSGHHRSLNRLHRPETSPRPSLYRARPSSDSSEDQTAYRAGDRQDFTLKRTQWYNVRPQVRQVFWSRQGQEFLEPQTFYLKFIYSIPVIKEELVE